MVKIGKVGKYKTPEYIAYEWELKPGLMKLKRFEKNVPVLVKLTFNVHKGVTLPLWKLKYIASNTTYRNCESKEMAESMLKDNMYIEYTPWEIKYGSKGDWDNITKPIMDFMETLGRIPNDRFVSMAEVQFTYNNPNNSIDIEVLPLEVHIDEENIYRFRTP